MFKKLFFVGLSLLVLSRESLGVEKGNVNSAHHGKVGLIDEVIHHVFTGSGDHSTRLQTDDEDLVDVGSGQGSGSGDRDRTETTTPRLTTKVTTLTPCEQLRRSAQNVSSDNYPKCTSSGEFERVQCHMNRKECWCVDRMGREITGSRMSQPKIPDCITGTGLKSCVFELLRSKYSLLGKFEPQCTFSGDYEKIQCFESGCWCVDEEGIQQRNTKVYKPAIPTCPEPTSSLPPTPVPDTDAPVTIKPIFPNHHDHRKKDKGKKTTEKPFISIDDTDDNDNDKNVDESIKPLDKVTPEEKAPYDVNTNNEGNIEINKPEGLGQSKSPIVHIMTQPGLLAAVIGGAVVGLLCAILLVMFIVYRMRKKDEGSYPLEEQKYTNYSYMKAPDKEFYA